MQVIKYPEKSTWPALLHRPVQELVDIGQTIEPVMQAVRKQGDSALLHYSKLFDKVELPKIRVDSNEIDKAENRVDPLLKSAIEKAIINIEKFHQSQLSAESSVETSPGVRCWRKNVAIEKVGFYVPAGSAPLFSTVIMLAVPAKIAGCRQIILCTPPGKEGNIHPAILYTAKRLEIDKIFRVGGAQAIAAMAYGTDTIPRVDKIFGPGNQYVTAAKMYVYRQGTAVDMPAGPSEVVVVADDSANPAFIAADLLSQAEHGADSQVILITDAQKLIEKVKQAVNEQLKTLPRRDIAAMALEHCRLILLNDLDEGMALVNAYAPEHLILMTAYPAQQAEQVINAGSVFLGAYSPESAGDYASGTNHVLATNGFARSFSGVSVESFLKKITFQQLTAGGLAGIAEAVERMAEAEGLVAHQRAVSIRLSTWKSAKTRK
jgi:histidinol dehydrogenase